MPKLCVDGIVTRYVNYRDNDRIISIFTIDQGRVDAKARGCRKPTSPLVSACQPFVFGQFELYAAHERNTITACAVKETFYPIREDYERFALGSAMLRLSHNAAPENEPNEALFALLYHALSFLAYGKSHPRDLFCCFLARYLNVIGYRPSITVCCQCGRDIRRDGVVRFSDQGGAVCNRCADRDSKISKTALEGMRRMLLLADDEMDRVALSNSIRVEVMTRLVSYTSSALEYGARALSALVDEAHTP